MSQNNKLADAVKFNNLESFNRYTNVQPPRHELIEIGAYPNDFRLSSPKVYPNFYRISIKYGLEKDNDKGYMYFSSPNQAIEWHTDTPWNGYYINLTEDLISSNQHLKYSFLTYGLHEALRLKKEEETAITQMFKAALQEYQSENFSMDILVAYCNLMFAHIAQFYKRQFGERKEQYSKLVKDFFSHLDTYYEQNSGKHLQQPSVQHFAQVLNVTSNYLSDLVKYHTGKSALEHIHQQIIVSAKPLLADKNLTVSEIAYQLGFEYPNYFSRLFRKITGTSPSDFRKL